MAECLRQRVGGGSGGAGDSQGEEALPNTAPFQVLHYVGKTCVIPTVACVSLYFATNEMHTSVTQEFFHKN